MQVKLKTATPNSEVNIVEIARVSSKRIDKSEAPEGLINYLIRNKHWSPFQHAYFTFEIVTSKAIGIQLLRHLSFTFQEFSQRYAEVEAVEDIEFRLQAEENRQSSTEIIGSVWQDDPHGNRFEFRMDDGFLPEDTRENKDKKIALYSWLEAVADYLEKGLDLYQEGLSLGVAKECARMILPMATQTTIYMTGSARSWIHFLEIRDDGHAQKEVQLVAKQIKKLFAAECPIIAKARGYAN